LIWLGDNAGYLSDWVTQRWVRATGRCVSLSQHPWLNGPIGNTRLIGKDFFEDYARKQGLRVVQSGSRGLLENFDELAGDSNEAGIIARAVKDFYERTSDYELDAWSEWRGPFKPFGTALAVLFSRRLQQLNVPLSSLDSSKGMSSDVLQLRDARSGSLVATAWVRELRATGDVLYAGSYSTCKIPGHWGPCIKVVFPLPNGSAMVIMKPEFHHDGSFSAVSAGQVFGDPGFYFVVRAGRGTVWTRHVRTLKETITVYPAEPGTIRADHDFRIWGKQFLQLHYRMRARA
jgi:hypothetical protein